LSIGNGPAVRGNANGKNGRFKRPFFPGASSSIRQSLLSGDQLRALSAAWFAAQSFDFTDGESAF